MSVETAADSKLAASGRRALGVTVVRCTTCGKVFFMASLNRYYYLFIFINLAIFRW